MKTILLTGPNGFIASHLYGYLSGHYRLVGLFNTKPKNKFHGYDSVYTNEDSLEGLFEKEGIDAIVNLATYYLRDKSGPIDKLINTNIELPVRLTNLAVRYKCKLFINIDSFFSLHLLENHNMEVYTNSKRFCYASLKHIVRDTEVKLCNLYLHHVYGQKDKGSKFIPWLVKELSLDIDEPLKLSSGIQKRDFIHVADVCRAIVFLIKKQAFLKRVDSFEVGTGKSIQLKEFILEVKKQIGSKRSLDFGAFDSANDIQKSIMVDKSLFELGWVAEVDYKSGISALLDK